MIYFPFWVLQTNSLAVGGWMICFCFIFRLCKMCLILVSAWHSFQHKTHPVLPIFRSFVRSFVSFVRSFVRSIVRILSYSGLQAINIPRGSCLCHESEAHSRVEMSTVTKICPRTVTRSCMKLWDCPTVTNCQLVSYRFPRGGQEMSRFMAVCH